MRRLNRILERRRKKAAYGVLMPPPDWWNTYGGALGDAVRKQITANNTTTTTTPKKVEYIKTNPSDNTRVVQNTNVDLGTPDAQYRLGNITKEQKDFYEAQQELAATRNYYGITAPENATISQGRDYSQEERDANKVGFYMNTPYYRNKAAQNAAVLGTAATFSMPGFGEFLWNPATTTTTRLFPKRATSATIRMSKGVDELNHASMYAAALNQIGQLMGQNKTHSYQSFSNPINRLKEDWQILKNTWEENPLEMNFATMGLLPMISNKIPQVKYELFSHKKVPIKDRIKLAMLPNPDTYLKTQSERMGVPLEDYYNNRFTNRKDFIKYLYSGIPVEDRVFYPQSVTEVLGGLSKKIRKEPGLVPPYSSFSELPFIKEEYPIYISTKAARKKVVGAENFTDNQIDNTIGAHEWIHRRNLKNYKIKGVKIKAPKGMNFSYLPPKVQEYFSDFGGTENYARVAQILNWYGLGKSSKISPKQIEFAKKYYPLSYGGVNNNMIEWLSSIKDTKALADWINNKKHWGKLFTTGALGYAGINNINNFDNNENK